MIIKDALSILGLSAKADPVAIKSAYRKCCSIYHPDRGGNLETMKAVNVAYTYLMEIGYNGTEEPINEEVNSSYGSELNEALNAVIGLQGLIIEVCGSYVWVSGDTRPHKTAIKEAGYYWASKKKMWYFKPDNMKSKGRGSYSMNKIRDTYGSETIKKPTQQRINS